MTSKIYDFCIIGSGPAGMTLAVELLETGKSICVLESGKDSRNQDLDKLKQVESLGEIIVKDNGRERIFGGTSTTWGGASAPMDKIDLDKWSVSEGEMNMYYEKVEKYSFPRLGDFDIVNNRVLHKNEYIDFQTDNLSDKIFITDKKPLNFAEKFKYIFERENVDLFLDTTVLTVNSEFSETITSEGFKNKIYSKIFIICTGGLEAPRLLLNSNNLGNEYDQVGKYLMDHPKGIFGKVILNQPIKKLPKYFGKVDGNYLYFAGLRLSEKQQKELGVLNSYIRLEPVNAILENRGIKAILFFTNKLKKARTFDYNQNHEEKYFLSDIFVNLVFIIKFLLNKFIFKKPILIKEFKIRNFMEMEALTNNQMYLSEMLDAYNQRISVVNMQISFKDKKSLIELHKEFQREILKQGLGIFESDLLKYEKEYLDNKRLWPVNTDASHYLGGTIMGKDAKTSVVDVNLKIHNCENVYICAGSVFPTSGCANPTYTICALASRLATHLKSISYTR